MANEISQECPYYHLVPKDPIQNVIFRAWVLRRAKGDPEFQAGLLQMCAADPLFFVNTFVCLIEPRRKRTLPFVTYEFQDRTLFQIWKQIGRGDIGIEKSRDQGASWMVLVLFLWSWLFENNVKYLLSSSTKEKVDSTDDEDALMPKIDFALSRLPSWMRPNYNRIELSLANLDRNNQIKGASTVDDIARGGRRLAIFCDEFASFETKMGYAVLSSSQPVTKTRIFLSTPKGPSGAYYDQMHREGLNILRIRLHWSEHPEQNKGLYTSTNGKLEIIDQKYRFPANYKFVLDGKLRSPYYDFEESRAAVPSIVSQELDIDYLGAASAFFHIESLERYRRTHCRKPILRGELDYDPMSGMPRGFMDSVDGRFKLWRPLGSYGRPQDDTEYVIGCDIGQGTGASESTAAIWDRRTSEKVGEFIDTRIDPTSFGALVSALARWFKGEAGNGAYVIFEANNAAAFMKSLIENCNYRNIYYRVREEVIGGKVTNEPGWWSNSKYKLSLMTEYRQAIHSEKAVNRSDYAIETCKAFCFHGDTVYHSKDLNALDPSGKGHNHGDIVIADALAWKGIGETGASRKEEESPDPPKNCFHSRREEARKAKSRKRRRWAA